MISEKAHERALDLLKEDVTEERGLVMEQLVAFLSALCQHNPAHRKAVGQASAITILSELLFPAAGLNLCGGDGGSPDVFGEVVRALMNLSQTSMFKEAMTS